MTVALTLVVLTEDSGASGWRPVVSCVRAICGSLIANIDWSRIGVLPREDQSDAVRHALAGNRWKGRDALSHSRRIDLVRYIANQLLAREGEARFVFFHVDADRRWSDGRPEACENGTKFRDLIARNVRIQLQGALEKMDRSSELDALVSRLHLVVPCTMIESWLYQSTTRAAELCRTRSCAGAHAAQYQAWESDRTLLDEVAQLKSRSDIHCLLDADKTTLAEALPVEAMRQVGRSFAATVDAVGEDGALLNALGRY